MKIRQKISSALATRAPGEHMTCVELVRMTGVSSVSLSSELRRMARKGVIVKTLRIGPRGGAGYRLKTLTETITDTITKSAMDQICEAEDAKVLMMLTGLSG